ncbi:DUF6881 domain-containing protein [Nocardia sp. NPDC058497]|uniref:DUF6881 domain-containing protein n=1 Tax=Nocardia sp. NPDC058497 TaxID=3346529 RepID=UPI0036481708
MIGEHADRDDVSDDLFMGLRSVAHPRWFIGTEPVIDRPTAAAAASGFEPPEPGLQYRRVTARAAAGYEPRLSFAEIDDEGYESRKVEYFPIGRMGLADGFMETELTQLADDPVESLEQISQRPGFTAEEITPEEFQVEWTIAGGEQP